MTHTRMILTIVGLAALALLATACSPSAAKLTGAGNDAFAEQAYEEALRSYQQAQAKSPELAEPYYNAANVLYRDGKFEEALAELQKATAIAQGDQVAQASYFNAGNSAFNTKSWDASIESYRQALLRDPNDQDAKVNLELALRQREQQDQQNKEDQRQEQDQQNNEDQKQQQDRQNKEDQKQEQDEQSQQGQNQQQDEQSQQGQNQQQDQQSQQGQDPKQQDQSQSQSQEGQPKDQQQNDPAQGDQQQNGQSQPSKDQNDQAKPGSQLAPGQRMTQDQARQLLAAIAGKADTLQGRLGQFLNVRNRPPVQDW